MNINDENFLTNFDPKQAVVGQVGYGYIGKAVTALFSPVFMTLVYDKFVPALSELDALVREAHVVFIAVPTPMDKSTGECHTGILESVLQDVQNCAVKVGRELDEFIVVIKSTVPPGFTRKMQQRFALRIVFSPEFLTEANSIQDFKNSSRVLLGGNIEDAQVVYKFFAEVWPDRLHDVYDRENDLLGIGPVVIACCDPEVAELTKLFTNGFLAAKVTFCNEMYQLCEKLGVKYDEVRACALLDHRIGQSHTMVPGPDGHLGYGGSCFVKDVNNLKHLASQLGLGDDTLFAAITERNDVFRPEKDWELLKGRAVVE